MPNLWSTVYVFVDLVIWPCWPELPPGVNFKATSLVASPANCTVPLAFGKLIVLSWVGSITSNVVSLSSAVSPSKIIPPEVLITSTSFCVVLTVTLRFLTLRVSVLGL